MNRALPMVLSVVCAWGAGADEALPSVADDLADRCDAVVATVSDYYGASFDKIVARKVARESFSAAIISEMSRHFADSDLGEYGPAWQAHFEAVGDQLAPELITGYLHYQCHTDTLDVSIAAASDPIDAACWNVAHDGKMEILDARMQHKDSTDLRRLSRARILACVTMSLSAPQTGK